MNWLSQIYPCLITGHLYMRLRVCRRETRDKRRSKKTSTKLCVHVFVYVSAFQGEACKERSAENKSVKIKPPGLLQAYSTSSHFCNHKRVSRRGIWERNIALESLLVSKTDGLSWLCIVLALMCCTDYTNLSPFRLGCFESQQCFNK